MNTQKKVIAVMYGIPDSYQHTSMNNVSGQPRLDVAYFNIQTETVSKLKDYLVRGDVVGIMGDRPAGRSYELVLVLGKLAVIDTSALRLSVLCNVKSYSVTKVFKASSLQSSNKVLFLMSENKFLLPCKATK